MNKTISVVIITRNRPIALARLLRSLNTQYVPPLEIIVVSASSDLLLDKTVVDRGYTIPIVLIQEKRLGFGLARNIGVKASKGSIVAFIDDDCEAPAHWTQAIVEAYASMDGDRTIVMGKALSCPQDSFWAQVAGLHYGNWSKTICLGDYCTTLDAKITSFDRRVFFEDNLWFDETIAVGSEDIEFGARLYRLGYTISYEPHITFNHYERTHFFEVLRQRWRIGLGEYEVSTKIPNLPIVGVLPIGKLSSLVKRAYTKLTTWTCEQHKTSWVIGYLFVIPLFFLVRVGAYSYGRIFLRKTSLE